MSSEEPPLHEQEGAETGAISGGRSVKLAAFRALGGSVLAVIVLALALIAVYPRPTHDALKLAALKAEAQVLMKDHPTYDGFNARKDRLPSVIASLKPDAVIISEGGVDIITKAYFDGGWGYFIPRDNRVLMEPAERFNDVGYGVFWHQPY